MYSVCQECKQYQFCHSPVMKGMGSLTPKLILVLDSPNSYEDQTGQIQLNEVLKKCLAEHIDEVYITYAVKCCTYKDTIALSGGSRAPSKQELTFCKKILFKELYVFPEEIPIMTFGNTSLSAFIGDHEGIQKEAGIQRGVSIHDKTFNLIPNFHPSAANLAKNPTILFKFKQILIRALSKNNEYTQEKYKLFNYEESIEYLQKVLEEYKQGKIDYIVFDIETTSLSPFKGKSIMYSFMTELDEIAYSVPLVINNDFKKEHTLAAFSIDETDDQKYEDLVKKYTVPFDITPTQAAKIDLLVKEVVETIPIVGQNLKFDLMFKMIENGYDLYKVKVRWDTQISGHQLIGPRNISLKDQARTLFNIEDDWDFVIKRYLGKYRLTEERNYGNLPTGILGEYSCLDAYWNKYLFKDHLEKLHPERLDILEEVTRATIPFAEAEGKGMYIDQKMYDFIKFAFDSALQEYLAEMRNIPQIKTFIDVNIEPLRVKNNSPRKRKKLTEEQMIEESFNPNSDNQIRILIHDQAYFGLPIQEKFMTKGGESGNKLPQTSADALSYLLINHTKEESNERKFIQTFLKHKELSTLMSRLEGIPENMVGQSYKTDFLLTGTVTGRLSSGMHSLPSKSDSKRIFTSRWMDEGGLFLCADYSQLEVRVAASIANEKSLIDAYEGDLDVHAVTASEMFNIPLEEVTKNQRGIAKAVVFGMLYGKTAYTMGPENGWSVEIAQEFIDKFLLTKPAIKRFIREQIEQVLRDGYIITKTGRVIEIPDAHSTDFKKRKHAENCAVNYGIQGPGSDIGLRAGNQIAYGLNNDKMRTLFLASVHDSFEYDVFRGELFYLIKKIKFEGEENIRVKYPWIKCPLKLDMSLGMSWGGALELNIKELTDNSLIATAEGLRKDFIMLEAVAKKAYQVQVKVIEESNSKPFPIDIVLRDSKIWKAEIQIKR